MIPLFDIPEIVQHYAGHFKEVFSEKAFLQFQRYVSGLIVSQNKTVEGINRLFVLDTRNQSSLNRLLTESPFSVEALNQARLEMLARLPGTQFKPRGVLSIDDTLLKHYGEHFDQIALLYDPTEQRYVWAHNLVNLHYSDDQTDYPVAFRLWQPADLARIEAGLRAAGVPIGQGKLALKQEDPKKWRQYLVGLWRRKQNRPEVKCLYQSKLTLAEEMLRRFVAAYPGLSLPVVFDNWYTQSAFCRFIDKTLHRPYVGTLAADDQVDLAAGPVPLKAFAEALKAEHQDRDKAVFGKITIRYKGKRETYYSYCASHRIKRFGKQRLVINHRREDLSDSPSFYISNRLNWQAAGITRIRRHRWPVEVYHEEGKADGLDQYQLRDFQAIIRHIALVAVVYSLLRAAQHDKRLLQRLQGQVETKLDGTAGTWRRSTQAQALWSFAVMVSTALSQGQRLEEVMLPVLRALYY